MDAKIINLTSHETAIFEPTKEKNWILNGKKNEGYDYVIDRYKYSPTNSAIIDSYANYIFGKGLGAKYTAETSQQWANIRGILSNTELRKICLDFALFEESAIEIILGKSGNNITSIYHLPKEKILPLTSAYLFFIKCRIGLFDLYGLAVIDLDFG